jgi:DNA polymerase-3 subunit delta
VKSSPSNASVVLVEGDDPVLVSEAVTATVREAIGSADWSVAVDDFRGEEASPAAVAEACCIPSLLGNRRVVVLRDVGRFKVDDMAPLLRYIDSPLEETLLVLAAGEGATPAKLLAAVKARGRVLSTSLSGRAVDEWLKQRLRAASVRLDPPAAALIREHLGEDVGRVGTLLAMLEAAHGEGARLGVAEVEPYLGEAGSVAPWTLTDAIDSGRTEEAITAMHRLLGAGERHPLVVHAIVARHVQDLLRLDDPEIASEVEAAAALGVPKGRSTYPAKKALGVAQRLGSKTIADAVEVVAAAEVDLKGASTWPPELVLEVMVARLCRLARASGSGRKVAPPRRQRSLR